MELCRSFLGAGGGGVFGNTLTINFGHPGRNHAGWVFLTLDPTSAAGGGGPSTYQARTCGDYFPGAQIKSKLSQGITLRVILLPGI